MGMRHTVMLCTLILLGMSTSSLAEEYSTTNLYEVKKGAIQLELYPPVTKIVDPMGYKGCQMRCVPQVNPFERDGIEYGCFLYFESKFRKVKKQKEGKDGKTYIYLEILDSSENGPFIGSCQNGRHKTVRVTEDYFERVHKEEYLSYKRD